ncbi:MAG: DUF6516 family protein [bacterium]
MYSLEDIRRIAQIEFADMVKEIHRSEHKLRIILITKGFVDIHLSQKLVNKFGFHWECMDMKGTIYRYDNFPDKKWEFLPTFPHHFHNSSQDAVESSPFPLTPIEGFRTFMEFIRGKLKGSVD